MPVKIIPKVNRGCGIRKAGGLYLFFDATVTFLCGRLPFKTPDACPVCGEHLRQIRSLQMINPKKLMGDADLVCSPFCPVCSPPDHGGLMWVGKKYYTPSSFAEEAHLHGISKRIATVPKGLKRGDLVFFAHPLAVEIRVPTPQTSLNGVPEFEETFLPGIFLAARLTEIQKVITDDQAKDGALVQALEDQGIQPVVESEVCEKDVM